MAGDQGSAVRLQMEAFGYWGKLEDSSYRVYARHLEIGALHFAMAVHQLEGFDEMEQRHLAAEAVGKALSVSTGWGHSQICDPGSESKYFYARYLADQEVTLHSLQPIPILGYFIPVLSRLKYWQKS